MRGLSILAGSSTHVVLLPLIDALEDKDMDGIEAWWVRGMEWDNEELVFMLCILEVMESTEL
jgi:hypothetical protein